MLKIQPLLVVSVLATAAVALSGCASGEPSAAAPPLRIVASTDVYASLAQELIGQDAEVSAIVTSRAGDPHSYEATPRDRLTVERADLVILNGGGYDSFMEGLVGADAGKKTLTVVEFAHDFPGADQGDHGDHSHGEGGDHAQAHGEHDHGGHSHGEHVDDHSGHDHADGDDHGHIAGFDEHVWYDPHTIEHFVAALGERLTELSPSSEERIRSAEQKISAQIAELEERLSQLSASQGGATVFLTEPVGSRLVAAAGLANATPPGFAEAVEAGTDVPPTILTAGLQAIESGSVKLLIVNTQTSGPETKRVSDAAVRAGVPVVEFQETVPEGQSYTQWMGANIDALEKALGGQ